MKAREDRPVEITKHAVDRFQDRRPLIEWDREQICAYIENEVRQARIAGRVQNHRPREFTLLGESRTCRPGQRICWTDGMTMAWIIAREPHADVVLTTLTPAGAVSLKALRN